MNRELGEFLVYQMQQKDQLECRNAYTQRLPNSYMQQNSAQKIELRTRHKETAISKQYICLITFPSANCEKDLAYGFRDILKLTGKINLLGHP